MVEQGAAGQGGRGHCSDTRADGHGRVRRVRVRRVASDAHESGLVPLSLSCVLGRPASSRNRWLVGLIQPKPWR